jgi:hypothetical protein
MKKNHLLIYSSLFIVLASAATIAVGAASNKLQAPTGLVAAPLSNTQISLSWTDGSEDETGFIVEGSLDGNFFYFVATTSANGVSAVSGGSLLERCIIIASRPSGTGRAA